MTTGEDSFTNKPEIRDLRQTAGKASARANTHSTMPITRERDDVPSLDDNPVSINVFPGIFPGPSSTQGDDDENGIARTNPSSGVTFALDKRTDQSFLSSPEFDEDSAQTTGLTRRTIAVPDSGDQEDEPPPWILEALKVSIVCAGWRLETYEHHGRIILLTLLESNQSHLSLNDFQVFSLFLPSLLHHRVPHNLVATQMVPSSLTNHLHGVFKSMT